MMRHTPSVDVPPRPRAEDDFEQRRRAVRAKLHTAIEAGHRSDGLAAAMHHVVAGGHLWRALFVLAVYEAAARRPWTDVVDCACAIELIHCSSIAIDDLPCIDDAATRRGRVTCHRVYGEAITIYTSHALVATADRLIGARARHDGMASGRLSLELAKVRRDLISGQMLEMALARGAVPADTKTLVRLCLLKGTGFRAAGIVAGRLAQCPPAVFRDILTLSSRVSIIYQLADDLADATLTAAAIGKGVGMDAGKRNFVTARGAGPARAMLDGFCEDARRALNRLPAPHPVERLFGHMRTVGVRLEGSGSETLSDPQVAAT